MDAKPESILVTDTPTPKSEDRKVNTFHPNYTPTYVREHPGTLQVSHMTKMHRFPKIFESARNIQPNARRVLSFGCSSGEEAFSLAHYFPEAEIVGVDIDFTSVSQARRGNPHPDRVFFHTDLGATGKYDLVTALMVFFCLEKPIAEEGFRKAICNIDAHLNPDGVLMVYTSDYDPATVPVIATGYRPLNVWRYKHPKNEKFYYCGYYRKNGLVSERILEACRKVTPAPLPQGLDQEFARELAAHLGSMEAVELWMDLVMVAFGKTPRQVIRDGDADELYGVVRSRWSRNPSYA